MIKISRDTVLLRDPLGSAGFAIVKHSVHLRIGHVGDEAEVQESGHSFLHALYLRIGHVGHKAEVQEAGNSFLHALKTNDEGFSIHHQIYLPNIDK